MSSDIIPRSLATGSNPHFLTKVKQNSHKVAVLFYARGQGFEPQLTGPKPAVLPLDDPRILLIIGFTC